MIIIITIMEKRYLSMHCGFYFGSSIHSYAIWFLTDNKERDMDVKHHPTHLIHKQEHKPSCVRKLGRSVSKDVLYIEM